MAGDVPVQATSIARFVIKVCSDPSLVAGTWAELEQKGTAFQTRAWLLPLYRIVAPKFNATPLFVSVHDRNSGRPLMFLPLCIRRRWGLRVIEFADFGRSDYNAPLLAPELAPDADQTREIWDDICACLPSADIVLFDKVPETISGRPLPLARLKWLRRMDMRAWAITLPKTRGEYDKTVLRCKDRKEHRRKRRNLIARIGDLTLVHATNEREGREIFEALRRQRHGRCQAAGYYDYLEDPRFRGFYEAVAFEAWGRLVALSALKAQGRIVATFYALLHKNNYLLVGHCFEPIAEGLSPGIVAIDEMVTHLIRSGAERFDFTIGNEGYKNQFGVEASLLYNGIWPLSPQGWLFVKAMHAIRRLKAALHPRLVAWRSQVRDHWRMITQGNRSLAHRGPAQPSRHEAGQAAPHRR